MNRLDFYENEKLPSGMKEYLSEYGWHFSKNMAKFASTKFFDGLDVNSFDKSIEKRGIDKLSQGYDAQFLIMKFKKIFTSQSDDQIFFMVIDYLKNNYTEAAFTNFYSDCIATSTIINWEDML